MKKQKFVALGIVLLSFIFNAASALNAQALTVEPAIPTYGLYCENSALIKGGSANFDFTNDELFSEGKCIKQSEYQIANANREVEFAIPFVSSAMNLPNLVVNVNGQKVEGAVWYGYNGFWANYEFDIEKTYSPVLDDSIVGTLYTFTPDSDTVTVSLKLNEWKSYIYETTNHYSSSNSADGSHTWTLKNASPLHEYSFFIFADSSECTFESSCGYKMQTITCNEYAKTWREKCYANTNKRKPTKPKKDPLDELRKYLNYEFSSGSYTGKDYKTFQNKYINYLRRLCCENGWELVNVGRNHYCFSCFIKSADEKYIYLSIDDVRGYRPEWYERVLIRIAAHEKDYHGKGNNYTSLEDLQDNVARLLRYA